MSTSIVLCNSLTFSDPRTGSKSILLHSFSDVIVQFGWGRRRSSGLIPNAKKVHSKKRSWWKKFFFDDDGNWLGLKDDDMFEEEEEELVSSGEEQFSEAEQFDAWKRRAEAIVELREAQEGLSNEEYRRWEDWLVDGTNDGNDWSWVQDQLDGSTGKPGQYIEDDPGTMVPRRGLAETLRDFVLGRDSDELLYEDKVFQYASFNSAKFLAALIIVPWALDFLVHDYILMPFLDRYVKTVPLAAEILDVRRHQKLEMVKELKLEKERYQFEVEIGKSPPISDEELWLELRHKALDLRDKWRLTNRCAFANIWSDMVFGISLFIILYFNQSKVALLKFTGYKIINNISDTGKAFLIILVTDIFLGYHSESGWQTLLEIVVEHYGFDVDQAEITIFVCLIPVIIDACVKLWMFKFLPKLSPRVANIFQEMKRH